MAEISFYLSEQLWSVTVVAAVAKTKAGMMIMSLYATANRIGVLPVISVHLNCHLFGRVTNNLLVSSNPTFHYYKIHGIIQVRI